MIDVHGNYGVHMIRHPDQLQLRLRREPISDMPKGRVRKANRITERQATAVSWRAWVVVTNHHLLTMVVYKVCLQF